MFMKNEFKAVLARRDMTISELAKLMNINVATLSKKVNNVTDFTRGEIQSIREILDLQDCEMVKIFFAKEVA